MSEAKPITAGDNKSVSKGRKIASGIILVGLLILLVIEGRAGFGHSSAGKVLKEMAPEGLFEKGAVTQEEFNAKMPLWPTITEIGETPTTVEYKYEWFSIFRPNIESLPPSVIYAGFTKEEPRHAVFFGTDAPDLMTPEEQLGAPSVASDTSSKLDAPPAAPDTLEAPSPSEGDAADSETPKTAPPTGDDGGSPNPVGGSGTPRN